MNANEARERTQSVRSDQLAADMSKIIARIEAAIKKGEFSTFVDFTLSLKIEMIKALEEKGFKPITSGNVTHAGRYQMKISWE